MKLQINYDIHTACKILMQQHLDKLGIRYEIVSVGEFELKEILSPSQFENLKVDIKKYGIEIIEDPKNAIAQKTKDIITEMVYLEDKLPNSNTSFYIADKLNLSYGRVSGIFSEVTYTTIANYIILQRIEYAKKLIVENKFTLTEIAHKLNYSSVPHLSTQFKKTTGLTPSMFQRIIKKRNQIKGN